MPRRLCLPNALCDLPPRSKSDAARQDCAAIPIEDDVVILGRQDKRLRERMDALANPNGKDIRLARHTRRPDP